MNAVAHIVKKQDVARLEEKMNKVGRPAKYKTPEELQKAVDSYFQNNDRITLSGLALHLGFESRQTLYNYAERDEFLDIIKKARMTVEASYEDRLIYESNATGVIFALKNMDWTDKQQTEHSGGVEIKLPPLNFTDGSD